MHTIRIFDKATSYLVAGHYYVPAYKSHRWDGKEHLIKFDKTLGYYAPIGLLEDIYNISKKSGFDTEIINEKKLFGPEIQYDWNEDIKLRWYQKEATNSICDDNPWWTYGIGLLKMPIRTGKTIVAASIIRQLGRRALFVVPSQILLDQTVSSLSRSLKCSVGCIGGGVWSINDVTAATIQSISKQAGGGSEGPSERYRQIAKYFDIVIWDEVHHAVGNVWRKAFMGFKAKYRIGLSATIDLDRKEEKERGIIWLKASCGNIKYEVKTSKLIKQGYLMSQNIELHKIKEPTGLETCSWGKNLVDTLIYKNDYRNRKIVEITKEKVDNGLKVLIVSSRLSQTKLISEIMDKVGIANATMTGKDNSSSKREKINLFKGLNDFVLVGTVFGEGVDIPEIECVINAEGGRDPKTTVQRMRNMTPSEGKKRAVLVDFVDLTNPYFAEHANERLKVYRSEEAFNIEIIE